MAQSTSAQPDDYQPKSYQDGIDNNDNKTDPLMNELNDDIVETLGVPAKEMKNEMDKQDPEGEYDQEHEDVRESLEDADEDQGDDTN